VLIDIRENLGAAYASPIRSGCVRVTIADRICLFIEPIGSAIFAALNPAAIGVSVDTFEEGAVRLGSLAVDYELAGSQPRGHSIGADRATFGHRTGERYPTIAPRVQLRGRQHPGKLGTTSLVIQGNLDSHLVEQLFQLALVSSGLLGKPTTIYLFAVFYGRQVRLHHRDLGLNRGGSTFARAAVFQQLPSFGKPYAVGS
jgi:hypothetical protein